MNIQDLKNKMNTVPDRKMYHGTPMNKPMKYHDMKVKAPKAKALEGAKTLGVNGASSHYGPGRIRSHEETRSMLPKGSLKQYDRQTKEIKGK